MDCKNLVEEMNVYFDRRAPLHDDLMRYASLPSSNRLMAPLTRLFQNSISQREVLQIACGTGRWTQILAAMARTVLATDINPSVLEIARDNCADLATVTFRTADAYSLGSVRRKYEAAFAADWWSHIPRSRIPNFLDRLHRKIRPGGSVVFVDMMPNANMHLMFSHYDEEGNLIQKRHLPDGQQFHVVKNFPTRQELLDSLGERGRDIEYYEHHALNRWVLNYRIA